MSKVFIHSLFSSSQADVFEGACAVVIDVLRATTTITCALQARCDGVRLFASPQEALDQAERDGRSRVVLGGERGGVLIPGFDLGNSPMQYTAQRVGGKQVYFTTTNGTAAALHVSRARRVWFGCLANLSAVVKGLDEQLREGVDVHLVCAGTNGSMGGDDVLVAGLMAKKLEALGHDIVHDEAGALGLLAAEVIVGGGRTTKESLAGLLMMMKGGSGLEKLGFAADILYCAKLDRCECVGQWDVAANLVVPLIAKD